LPFGVAHCRFVVFRGSELEVLGGFTEVALQFLRRFELALDVRALAQKSLRFALIVPEIGGASLLV
jgi:hypothetical protein